MNPVLPPIVVPDFNFDWDFSGLLVRISEYGQAVIYFFSGFFALLSQNIHIYIPSVIDVNFTILEVMLGAGLAAFVTFTIYKWLKGLIPFV